MPTQEDEKYRAKCKAKAARAAERQTRLAEQHANPGPAQAITDAGGIRADNEVGKPEPPAGSARPGRDDHTIYQKSPPLEESPLGTGASEQE